MAKFENEGTPQFTTTSTAAIFSNKPGPSPWPSGASSQPEDLRLQVLHVNPYQSDDAPMWPRPRQSISYPSRGSRWPGGERNETVVRNRTCVLAVDAYPRCVGPSQIEPISPATGDFRRFCSLRSICWPSIATARPRQPSPCQRALRRRHGVTAAAHADRHRFTTPSWRSGKRSAP